MSRVILITGGSSGIGMAAAQLLSSQGDTVWELSRHDAGLPGIRHISVDLRDETRLAAAIAEIGAASGHIDVLINNAGMGISGPLELTELDAARRLFELDFFAAAACVKYALPWLRAAGAGAKIINISSVAAVFAIPYQAYYSAAKAAVSALTLALANELRGFDISVSALLPGDVQTGFTAAREKSDAAGLYPQAAAAVAAMERDEQQGTAPDIIAARIAQLSRKKRLKPFYSCGFKYQFFLFLGKILPSGVANSIVNKMYS